MWLLNYVTQNSIKKSDAVRGNVSQTGNTAVSVNASSEHREIPVAAPFGIAYVPPVGEESVVLPVADGEICLGVIAQNKQLSPGELMLYSSGGAYIYLKNDGTVEINGKQAGV